jgi:hypothetical protein
LRPEGLPVGQHRALARGESESEGEVRAREGIFQSSEKERRVLRRERETEASRRTKTERD